MTAILSSDSDMAPSPRLSPSHVIGPCRGSGGFARIRGATATDPYRCGMLDDCERRLAMAPGHRDRPGRVGLDLLRDPHVPADRLSAVRLGHPGATGRAPAPRNHPATAAR